MIPLKVVKLQTIVHQNIVKNPFVRLLLDLSLQDKDRIFPSLSLSNLKVILKSKSKEKAI